MQSLVQMDDFLKDEGLDKDATALINWYFSNLNMMNKNHPKPYFRPPALEAI